MSYIFNNSIKYSDSVNLDAFGRLRVSEVNNIIELKQTDGETSLIVGETTGGSVTSTFNKTLSKVTMTTSANNSYVIRQSKFWATYQPGKSQFFEASFGNFQLESNIIKRVGMFNSSTASTYNTLLDGLYLESNGVTNEIAFFIQRSGTTVYSAESSTWNSTEFDPTSIDWTKVQLIFIDYQWLGVGRVRFGLNYSGNTIIFAEHTSTNNDTEIYMSYANQPIRYEIRQIGIGSGTFDMICSQISSEGSSNDLFFTTSVPHTTTTTLVTSGTKYPYIGVRLKENSKSVSSNFSDAYILNTSNDNYLLTLELNPTLSSSPTWTSLDDTPFEYSLQDGSKTITNPGYIISSLIGEAGSSALSSIKFQDNKIKFGSDVDGTKDEMWICITPLGANATFIGTTNLIYEN